jgi:hypothetical protein
VGSDSDNNPGYQKKKYPVKDFEGPGSIIIRLMDETGMIGAGVKYELQIGEEKIKGVADSQGLIKYHSQKLGDKALLNVEGVEIELTIVKDLDPIESIKGAQQRLKNLGYSPGNPDGNLGPRTKEALIEFQKLTSSSLSTITPNGRYGIDTQEELQKVYGS